MVTTSKQVETNLNSGELSFEASRVDYKLLGLNVAESRVDVIRAATRRKARRAYEGAANGEGVEAQLSNIALTAYRLLDPRRRLRISERVQLCYPLDREDEVVSTPLPMSILNAPPSQMPIPLDASCERFESIEYQLSRLIDADTDETIEESRQIVEFLRRDSVRQHAIRQTQIYRWTSIIGSCMLGFAMILFAFASLPRGQSTANYTDASQLTEVEPRKATQASNLNAPQDSVSKSKSQNTVPVTLTDFQSSDRLDEANAHHEDEPQPIAAGSEKREPNATDSANESSVGSTSVDSELVTDNPKSPADEPADEIAQDRSPVLADSLLRIEGSKGLVDWAKPFTFEMHVRSDWGIKSKQWLIGDVELVSVPGMPNVQVAGWQAWLEPGNRAGNRLLFIATSSGVQLDLPVANGETSVLGISSDGTTAKVWQDGKSVGEFKTSALQQSFKSSSQMLHVHRNALNFKASQGDSSTGVARMWNVSRDGDSLVAWQAEREPNPDAILWIDRDSSGLWLDMARGQHAIRTVGMDSLPAIQQTQVQRPSPPEENVPDPWLSLEQASQVPDADLVAEGNRAELPDETELKQSRDRLTRIFKDKQASAKTSPEVRRQLTVELTKLARESEPGSADRFAVLESLIANSLEDAGLVAAIRNCDRLEQEFEYSAWKKRVELFELQAKRAETLDAIRELTLHSCQVAELALQNEELDAATELFRLAIVAGNRSQDDELKSLSKRRKDDVVSVRRRITAMTKAKSRLEHNDSDANAAADLGLFLAIVKGDWSAAAPWLAKTNDKRWKSIGELEANAPSDIDSQSKLGILLSECAVSLKGRESDAIRLRAIHWLEQAVTGARGLLRVEIEDLLAKQKALLPLDRQPQSSVRFSNSPNEDSKNVKSTAVVDTPEELQGMLGRILLNGMDAGVLLRYENGVEINDAQIVDILNSANRQGNTIRLEFVGLLMLNEKTDLSLVQLAGSAQMGFGQVSVDGKIVGQMGGQEVNAPSAYSLTLEPGEHRVVWTLSGGRLGTCRLQAQFGEANQPVPLAYTPALLTQMKSLPTPLRVNLVRSKAKRT